VRGPEALGLEASQLGERAAKWRPAAEHPPAVPRAAGQAALEATGLPGGVAAEALPAHHRRDLIVQRRPWATGGWGLKEVRPAGVGAVLLSHPRRDRTVQWRAWATGCSGGEPGDGPRQQADQKEEHHWSEGPVAALADSEGAGPMESHPARPAVHLPYRQRGDRPAIALVKIPRGFRSDWAFLTRSCFAPRECARCGVESTVIPRLVRSRTRRSGHVTRHSRGHQVSGIERNSEGLDCQSQNCPPSHSSTRFPLVPADTAGTGHLTVPIETLEAIRF
jgi:hypothetical protein